MNPTYSINKVPSDVLLQIFKDMNATSVTSLFPIQLTCRLWKGITDPTLINLKRRFDISKEIDQVCSHNNFNSRVLPVLQIIYGDHINLEYATNFIKMAGTGELVFFDSWKDPVIRMKLIEDNVYILQKIASLLSEKKELTENLTC